MCLVSEQEAAGRIAGALERACGHNAAASSAGNSPARITVFSPSPGPEPGLTRITGGHAGHRRAAHMCPDSCPQAARPGLPHERGKRHARVPLAPGARPPMPADRRCPCGRPSHPPGLPVQASRCCRGTGERVPLASRLRTQRRVPHPATLMKLTGRCGEAAVASLNEALWANAAGQKLLRTTRVRADTAVIGANVVYPTDSGSREETTGAIGRLAGDLAGLWRGACTPRMCAASRSPARPPHHQRARRLGATPADSQDPGPHGSETFSGRSGQAQLGAESRN